MPRALAVATLLLLSPRLVCVPAKAPATLPHDATSGVGDHANRQRHCLG